VSFYLQHIQAICEGGLLATCDCEGTPQFNSPTKMFSIAVNKRRRSAGFPVSLALHAGAFYVLVSSSFQTSTLASQPAPEHKYSVLVLRLEDFPRTVRSGEKKSGAAGDRASASSSRNTDYGKQSPSESQSAATDQALADAITPPATGRRQPFVLPPVPHREPVKQTLIQPDVPPDIQLKTEIPLVTAVLWEKMPRIPKKFVAPVAPRKPQPVAEVPAAPELAAPNRQVTTADLKIAAALANDMAKLARPPAKTPAIRGEGLQPLSEPPQIAMTDSTDTSLAALISLPDSPVISGQTIAIPPANQVAPSGAGGSGNSGGNRGGRNGSSESPSSAASGRAASGQAGNFSSGTGDSDGPGRGSAIPGSAGTAPQGGGGTGTMLASASSGAGVSGAGGNGFDSRGQDLPISGTTRLTLPKDGKFTVVVTGSSLAAPYAESVGALTGKMIYSVYVGVGLRKKWILQYCLPRNEEQKTVGKGRTQPVEAPWPYLVVRPDELGTSNREYVIVHGILTTDGRLDQLTPVFPQNLERRDLLMSSLKQWTFRPATRDGVPSDVEILLIIPSQSD
jgi:hypothetical protein